MWPKPVPAICIHCDSQSTIGRAQSHMYNGKSRHIRRRHNTVRQLLSNGIISIDYVKSKDNIADPLTKGLARELLCMTVDTPFLTDLKTQTSPVERSVMLHIVLVLRFQSLGCEPCLRTSGLFCALPRFANQVLFSLPKGRERSRRPSLRGRRLRFVVVGHFSYLKPGFRFSEPSAVCLGSRPLNYLRLLRFLAHILFTPFRGTLWPGRPPSWSYATSGA
ncbi:hypothetical protein CsSME_00025418 [Camellia sinensis var. sinensis]